MKRKFILLPVALTTLTPMIGMVGCNNPQTTKYRFEFIGNNCSINNHSHIITQIEENTKVEYTVLPDPGFKLSSTQELPDGVTLFGNILTIAKMDKPYKVTINAEATSEPALVINDLEETYEGTAGKSGHTGKITVNLVEGESKTDVTNEVNFNISTEGILAWDKTEQWFTWTDKLSPKEEGYECSIQATFGSFISKTHTLLLQIHGDLTFYLTEFEKTTPEAVFSFSNVNLSPGIEYKAYIDTEPHAEEWDWANGWSYLITDASATTQELMVNKVSIDGTDLDKIEEGWPDENQFIVLNVDSTHWVQGGWDLVGTHHVWITFTVKEELTNVKLLFIIGLQH